LTLENSYKWDLMNNTIEDINSIKMATKVKELKSVILIIADDWKFDFYSNLMSLIENTKNQAEIMKVLLKNENFKSHSKLIGQLVTKILKNIGKFTNFNLSKQKEHQFFTDIKPIIQRKFNCDVEVILEQNSKSEKKSQALPGKPAIVIQ
ncbi:MAG: hypothetical protein ACFE9R_09045, partial [Candidatus Hermodarchaeota archaeon]